MASLEARHPAAAASASSSEFLLLTTDPSTALLAHPSSIPLAPPRFRLVLQVAAVLDLVTVLGYGSRVPLSELPPSAIVINSTRSLVVLAAVSSRRVREHAPVLLAQLIVSALVLLYRFNELIQTSSSLALPPVFASHRLLNRISIWYGASFAWAVAHYILFVLFIGVGKRRNPFVERPPNGARRHSSRRRRRSTWNEHRWEGRQESVSATTRPGVRSNSLSQEGRGERDEGHRSPGNNEDEAEEGFLSGGDDDEDDDEDAQSAGSDSFDLDSSEEESDDDDDLIDIPKPGHSNATLRNRASRASLLSLPAQPVSRENALQASRNYGSMRSLCASLSAPVFVSSRY
ncbi:hypothetical protein JCM11491_004007 [Sporobolomyces phaffii]